jgi:sec-independent protein translocase protein TatA
MSVGIGELLLILVIVFVLFGAGKLPQVMNDIGKGIKGLKKGLKDEEKILKDEEKILKSEETNLENKTETVLNKIRVDNNLL